MSTNFGFTSTFFLDISGNMADSNLIQVRCTTTNDDGSLEQHNIAIPEDMGCDASARLRYLCKRTDQRVFSADEVVGEPIVEFEARIYEGSFFHTLMKAFQGWLYGFELGHYDCAIDLWYLGDTLGSPTFQNAAMLLLCRRPDYYNPEHIDCVLYQAVPGDALQSLFTQAYFDDDENYGCDLERDTIYWGNKKMLKFHLDLFAYFGTRDNMVRSTLHEGGNIAVQLYKIIEGALTAGGFNGGPWEDHNIQKYLVDEDSVNKPEISPRNSPMPSSSRMVSAEDEITPEFFFADDEVENAFTSSPSDEQTADMMDDKKVMD